MCGCNELKQWWDVKYKQYEVYYLMRLLSYLPKSIVCKGCYCTETINWTFLQKYRVCELCKSAPFNLLRAFGDGSSFHHC